MVRNENIPCGYRSFKLFIPGEHMVQFLIANAQTFHLVGKYSVYDNEKYELPLNGYWGEEYKIRVSANQVKNLGVGIEVHGDFEKFYNWGDGDNIFTWRHFNESVQRLLEIVPADAKSVHVINLEAILEVEIPYEWNIPATGIINNIMRFKGKYNYRQDKDFDGKGYTLQFAMSEYRYNIWNKMKKDGTGINALKIGIEVKKSSYLKDRGIVMLSDLLIYNNHKMIVGEVAELFNHIIIYQKEVDNQLLLIEEEVYCRNYNKAQAWNALHKNNPHKYKYLKGKLEALIENVCKVSFKKELQQILASKIKGLTEAVPDFPLYIEKREVPPTTIPFSQTAYSQSA